MQAHEHCRYSGIGEQAGTDVTDGTFNQTFDGMFDRMFDGMFDGMFCRTFDGTFDGTLDGMFDGAPWYVGLRRPITIQPMTTRGMTTQAMTTHTITRFHTDRGAVSAMTALSCSCHSNLSRK